MTYKQCPICNSELTETTDYLDGHTLLELTQECPHKHFCYTYLHGYTEIFVTNVSLGWSYHTDPHLTILMSQWVTQLIALAREQSTKVEIKGEL
jgi:hypothetical protein